MSLYDLKYKNQQAFIYIYIFLMCVYIMIFKLFAALTFDDWTAPTKIMNANAIVNEKLVT